MVGQPQAFELNCSLVLAFGNVNTSPVSRLGGGFFEGAFNNVYAYYIYVDMDILSNKIVFS